jgi:hypothetical protein
MYDNSLTSSELVKPSISSTHPVSPYEPIMDRKRGYDRSVDDTGVCFGRRLGLRDCDTSTAAVTQDRTSAITDHSSPLLPAPSAKPYSGNVFWSLKQPFVAIPDTQIDSKIPQHLAIPVSPLPDAPAPYKPYESFPPSHCGRQAESIKPSWSESGTALLERAKSFCRASVSNLGEKAGKYRERWALSRYQSTARQSSYGSSSRGIRRTGNISSMIEGFAKALPTGLYTKWTQCTGNRTRGAAARSTSLYGED